MNRKLLEEQWRDYVGLLSFDEVALLVAPMEDFCDEQVQLLLPTTKIGTSGAVLHTILACTQNYLSELSPVEKTERRFDIVARHLAVRFDITWRDFELAQPEGSPLRFPSVSLEVTHGGHATTGATFIGGDSRLWLERAKTIFPPTSLLRK